MPNKKAIDYDTFIVLLKDLDERLSEINTAIEIKAIGGFAAMYHAKESNIRGREKTCDIDDLVKLDNKIKEFIAEIGIKHHVEEDWLNNDWIDVKVKEELEAFAYWQDVDCHFTNIVLRVLDIKSLFLFKMRAIETKIYHCSEPPRQQDIADVLMLLNILGEYDVTELSDPIMASYADSYPMARDFISGKEIIG